MSAFDELDRLIEEAPKPYELLHLRARRLVLKAIANIPASDQLASAIEAFHTDLEYMTLSCDTYDRQQISLKSYQDLCRASLRFLRAIPGKVCSGFPFEIA